MIVKTEKQYNISEKDLVIFYEILNNFENEIVRYKNTDSIEHSGYYNGVIVGVDKVREILKNFGL